jgi:signal peptidase II
MLAASASVSAASASSAPLRSPAALARFFLTAIIGVSLDLWTKSLAVAHLKRGDAIDLVHGLLRLEYTENHGAVFGMAQGQRWVFLAVSAGALGFLIYLFSTSVRRPFYQVVLGMLLAGVMGNMYDRVQYGYVRDLLHGLPGWYWPAWVRHALPSLPGEVFPWIFNVADSLLCVGVGLLLIYSFFQPVSPTRSTEAESAAPAAAAPPLDAHVNR